MKKILLSIVLILMFSPANAEETLRQSEKRLMEAFEFLTENYIEELDSEALVDKLIIQMTYDLDKNTRFLKPQRSKKRLDSLHRDNVYVMSEIVRDNILYSRVTLFGVGAARQLASDIFKFSIQLAIKQKTKIAGFILDLRHNSGGWLPEAVKMTNMFIDYGLILEERGRHGEVTFNKHASSKMVISKQVPIIILIDGDTASAAEIVASALKDHNRAMLLGVTSFGKATVQSYEDFENGSTLWVTSQKYYTKSGIEIHGNGVTPNVIFHPTDVVITFSASDSQVKKAIELLTQ